MPKRARQAEPTAAAGTKSREPLPSIQGRNTYVLLCAKSPEKVSRSCGEDGSAGVIPTQPSTILGVFETRADANDARKSYAKKNGLIKAKDHDLFQDGYGEGEDTYVKETLQSDDEEEEDEGPSWDRRRSTRSPTRSGMYPGYDISIHKQEVR